MFLGLDICVQAPWRTIRKVRLSYSASVTQRHAVSRIIVLNRLRLNQFVPFVRRSVYVPFISDIENIGMYSARTVTSTIAPTMIIISGSSSVMRVPIRMSTLRS
jgi:hypothetical protein